MTMRLANLRRLFAPINPLRVYARGAVLGALVVETPADV
jgi:hypothetical protein